jgi:7-cyano-7-deazaguanine synthase in queuosine biosynthesis
VREIRVGTPVISDHDLIVTWTEEPGAGLCRPTSFRLTFPAGIDLSSVPEALRWTVALLCLHPQWALQRPCRVTLPVALGDGVAETWLRLIDAAVFTHDRTAARHAELEGRWWGEPPARGVEIVEDGPPLPAVDADAWFGSDGGQRAVSAFSGGKDSLLQLALLDELGFQPTAVAVTSPLPGRADQTSARRSQVFAEITRRLPVELVEVTSELRASLDSDAPAQLGWHISLTEMTDTHLYLAAALVVAWCRRSRTVAVASEAEVQESTDLDGEVVQHPHLMYSAATQLSIAALVAPLGMAVGSLTYPLPSGLVQHLLWTRYPEVRGLQYSCWRLAGDESACSACSQCLRVSMAALRAGGAPAEMGIDLERLLRAQAGWRPDPKPPTGLPDDAVRASLHGQVVGNFAAIAPDRVAALTGFRRHGSTVRAYRRLRRAVLAVGPVPPAQGYRPANLELVPGTVRTALGELYEGALPVSDPGAGSESLARTRRLVAWTTAPLEPARR